MTGRLDEQVIYDVLKYKEKRGGALSDQRTQKRKNGELLKFVDRKPSFVYHHRYVEARQEASESPNHHFCLVSLFFLTGRVTHRHELLSLSRKEKNW